MAGISLGELAPICGVLLAARISIAKNPFPKPGRNDYRQAPRRAAAPLASIAAKPRTQGPAANGSGQQSPQTRPHGGTAGTPSALSSGGLDVELAICQVSLARPMGRTEATICNVNPLRQLSLALNPGLCAAFLAR